MTNLRIRCVLWGCWCDENSACPKCGAAIYDADFIQIGKLAWMHRVPNFFRRFRCFITRRCDVCKKRMWLTRSECCCPKCESDWIPF